MDGVALDGAGADDRDLDHEVLEALGRGLGSACIWARDSIWNMPTVSAARIWRRPRVVVGERVEVGPLAGVLLDAVEDVADHAKGPQGEEVDLHQPQRLDVLLVELRHHAAGHGGALDGDQVDERGPRDQHAADMDSQVTREAVDLRAEGQEPLPPVARRRVEARRQLRAELRAELAARIALFGATVTTPRRTNDMFWWI